MAAGPLAGVRRILETPILDEHKWAKVPTLPTDAVLLDLEDSVPPARKAEARAAVVSYLARPGFFAGRLALPRPNPLGSPEGPGDLAALAGAGVSVLAYPKARSAEEVAEVGRVLRAHGAAPGLVVIVETAPAVLDLERIARVPGVAGLILGPADLADDVGWSLLDGEGVFADAYHYPKSKLVLTGAAYGVPVYDTVFVADLRDQAQVRRAVHHARRLGFTGMTTFYPPHLEVITEVFTPSAAEEAAAREVVAAYEAALARGEAAVEVGGRAVIVQDYKAALRTLGRAGPA
ncbi:MAG TPA: aldolase/citrate lyase family protein [Acidimicrobiales bacterium]|nr:aldolase/citrate lyase family protein [Acidimicrobiales bacterium]